MKQLYKYYAIGGDRYDLLSAYESLVTQLLRGKRCSYSPT